jgi:NTE family protein
VTALVGGLSGRRDHLVPDRALRRLLRRHVELDDLSEAATPLHVVAFDLTDGREVLLSQGPALDALVASSSIPGIFPPVRMADRRLIDGGVVNNTPISHAVELGAQRIYVLATQEPFRPRPQVPRGALDTAIHGLELLVRGRLEADMARYSSETELIVLPPSNSHDVQPTNFEHSSRLIREALSATRTLLDRRDLTIPRNLRVVGG